MSQIKKTLPFIAFIIFGIILYTIGNHPESKNYSQILFSCYLMIYTIWFITSLSSSHGNYGWVVAAFVVTFIITWTIPQSLVNPLNCIKLIGSLAYGVITGGLTYYFSK